MSAPRGRRPSPQRERAQLAERLRERRAEIEQAVLARVSALEDPTQTGDPAYVEGLRAAVGQAVAYALEGIERSESRPAPIPTALLAQARHAARDGVSLDTVLRRYLAGYTLLGDFLHQAAEETGLLGTGTFQRLRRDQAALLDRLLAAISEEHGREPDPWRRSSSERRAELVRRLLAGELLDAAELGYALGAWHVGALAAGDGAEQALTELAAALDCHLLLVPHADGRLWAWLGGRERTTSAEVARLAEEHLPETIHLALGEPGEGVRGWRFTHRQAALAWPLTQARGERVVRYGEVALLASMLQDEVLVTSLRELYLAPLDRDRDGGSALRDTLRAYFAAERNVSSAAAALGVSRQAVASRLRRVESRLGRPIGTCAGEIEAALRLEDVTPSGGEMTSPSRRTSHIATVQRR